MHQIPNRAALGREEEQPQVEQGIWTEVEGILENPAENAYVLGGGACCCLIFVLLAFNAIGTVPPLFYGVRYNTFWKSADTVNVYNSGRHFVGPWNTFVLFPANVQTVEFSSDHRLASAGARFPALHTRTKEGLALHLQVSLQYQLKGLEVGSLYAEFNVAYEAMFISTIRDTLIKAAAEYEAAELWEQRKDVGSTMQRLVNASLSRTYATCWGLQLMVIELPQNFDAAIVRTQVQKQNVTTMHFSKDAARIEAETRVIEATYNKTVTVTLAYAEANYTLQTKVASANARKKTLDVEAEVLKKIKDRLSVTGSHLVDYQQYNAIQMLPNASVYFGFEDTTQVLLQGAGGSTGVSPMVGGGSRRLEAMPSAGLDGGGLGGGLPGGHVSHLGADEL